MLALDVNVILTAFRPDLADHDELRIWLEDAVNAPEPVGLSDAVLAGVLRLLTHRRVFEAPTPLNQAIEQVTALRDHPGTLTLVPGQRNWEIFTELCKSADTRGNLVADAQHAAVAVEHGATWVSKDRDFARFPGLRWRHPLDLR